METVYRLKKGPEFEEMSGTHAGRKYRKGEVYKEKDIPPGKKDRFEPVVYKEGKEPQTSDLGPQAKSEAKKPQTSDLKPQTETDGGKGK